MKNPLGCNTLYPHGRLKDAKGQFNFAAHCQALRELADAGFAAVEFSHPEALTLDELAAVGKECRALGLTPWSAHCWVAAPASMAEMAKSQPGLLDGLDRSGRLGVQVMVVHAAGSNLDMAKAELRAQRAEALSASLTQLSRCAATNGHVIAVENCGPMPDLEFLVQLLGSLNLRNVGFNIDTGHAQVHKLDIPTALRLMGPRLLTTHLQDNFGQRDDHLPPGLGTIDWKRAFAAFREIGYGRTLMVEISDCPPGREPEPKREYRQACENLLRFANDE